MIFLSSTLECLMMFFSVCLGICIGETSFSPNVSIQFLTVSIDKYIKCQTMQNLQCKFWYHSKVTEVFLVMVV